MSMRFPHHGPSRRESPAGSQADAWHDFSGPALLRDNDSAVPDRACCCPAKPMVKVVMPANASRPEPVDLWLCGHHWRVSHVALARAGATVYDVSNPSAAAGDRREEAPV